MRSVCAERLGRTPTVFALGDVCRGDLLVEIEGMAFSQLAEDPAAIRGLPETAGTVGRV